VLARPRGASGQANDRILIYPVAATDLDAFGEHVSMLLPQGNVTALAAVPAPIRRTVAGEPSAERPGQPPKRL